MPIYQSTIRSFSLSLTTSLLFGLFLLCRFVFVLLKTIISDWYNSNNFIIRVYFYVIQSFPYPFWSTNIIV